MSRIIHNAKMKFRYNVEEDVTRLLVQFPGDDFYTQVATRHGQITLDEANKLVEAVIRNLREQGLDVQIG